MVFYDSSYNATISNRSSNNKIVCIFLYMCQLFDKELLMYGIKFIIILMWQLTETIIIIIIKTK